MSLPSLALTLIAPLLVAATPPATPADQSLLSDQLALKIPGEGVVKPGLVAQMWGQYDDVGPEFAAFKLRRLEFSFSGSVLRDLIDFRAAADFKAGTPFITDAYATIKTTLADVTFGQFRIPLSYEGADSSAKLLMPERSLVSRWFGDRRDLGVRASKKIDDQFFYSLALLNGSGANNDDKELAKDVALRLEYYPFDGAMVGVVGYTTIGNRGITRRDRVEFDLRYVKDPWLLTFEAIRAYDKNNSTLGFGTLPTGFAAGTYNSFGWAAALAYKITPEFQPILRGGNLDRVMGVDGGATAFYEAGFNYYVSGQNMKLQLSASHFDNQHARQSTDVIAAAQVFF